MPKIVVSTPELKPNSSWYTRYSGDGTPDAASIRTRSTATDQKAAGRDRRRESTNSGKRWSARLIPGHRRVAAGGRGSGSSWRFPASSSWSSPAEREGAWNC